MFQAELPVPLHRDLHEAAVQPMLDVPALRLYTLLLIVLVFPVLTTQTTCHLVHVTALITPVNQLLSQHLQRCVPIHPGQYSKNHGTNHDRLAVIIERTNSLVKFGLNRTAGYLTLLVFSFKISLSFVPFFLQTGSALYLCLETRSSQFHRPLPPH